MEAKTQRNQAEGNQAQGNQARGKSTTRWSIAAAFVALGVALVPSCALSGRVPFHDGKEQSDDEMQLLMSSILNPALTRLSYALFHDKKTPLEERFQVMVRESSEIQSAASKLVLMKPPHFQNRLADYREFVALLRDYSGGLTESALEQDLRGSRLWFQHLKNVCTSCHHVYRLGEQEPIRRWTDTDR